jgi:phage terminase large subunit-like protein
VVNYIPKQRLIDDHVMKDQYNAWEQGGYIVATEGEVTDYEYIKRDIENAVKIYDVQSIGFDPANANELANTWTEYEDISVVEIPQRASQLSESQQKLAALIIEKKIDHGNDSCLKWQASNIVVRNFADETILYRKEKEYLKIDGMVASSMAVKGWFELKPPESSVYEERGIRSL